MNIYQIIALVLVNSSAYKGVRLPLLGGYANRGPRAE